MSRRRSPQSPSKGSRSLSESNGGFRLSYDSRSGVNNNNKCDTESVTSSSSKQRIDKMFEQVRSVECGNSCNVSSNRSDRLELKLNQDADADADPDADVDAVEDADQEEESQNDVQARIERMFTEVSNSQKGQRNRGYNVKHLGQIPVEKKITSLEELQAPTRELYFKCVSRNDLEKGGISVSEEGLLVDYCKKYGGRVTKLNTFSAISVWAALKFVRRPLQGSSAAIEYAFLPLVSIEKDKDSLLRKGFEGDGGDLMKEEGVVFVAVMREPDVFSRQLIFHAFLCECAQNAVDLAASLYTALMANLGRNRALRSKQQRQRLKQMNGVSRLSSIGETVADYESESSAIGNAEGEKESNNCRIPERPPRKSKERKSRRRDSDVGDILTKVAIPRSSSFLNTNRLGFSHPRGKETDHKEIQTDSPLGFMEMFDELRKEEGLETVDEILNVIVKAEGMSFNDLKPIYKEFLLKLSLVLSKEELFRRSETIMKKQRVGSKTRRVVRRRKGLRFFQKLRCGGRSRKRSKKKRSDKNNADTTSVDSFYAKPQRSGSYYRSRRKFTKNKGARASKYARKRTLETPHSSSGYFSFSECSYDTDTCTCSSTDKCYCSLPDHSKCIFMSGTQSSGCSCDTAACAKQGKCYCKRKLSLVEQLKRDGFAASESSLESRVESKRKTASSRMDTYANKEGCLDEGSMPVDYSMFVRRRTATARWNPNVMYAQIARPAPEDVRFAKKDSFYGCKCDCMFGDTLLPRGSQLQPQAMPRPQQQRQYQRSRSANYFENVNLETCLGYYP